MPTWHNCSSNRRSCGPASISPAPKKARCQAIGRSRGGLSKLHVAMDAWGNPLRIILSAGQIADLDCAAALIANLPGQAVVADKGNDADHCVAKVEATGATAAISPHPMSDSTLGRSASLPRSQSDRALFRTSQAFQLLHRASRDPRRMKQGLNSAAASGKEVGSYLV